MLSVTVQILNNWVKYANEAVITLLTRKCKIFTFLYDEQIDMRTVSQAGTLNYACQSVDTLVHSQREKEHQSA